MEIQKAKRRFSTWTKGDLVIAVESEDLETIITMNPWYDPNRLIASLITARIEVDEIIERVING